MKLLELFEATGRQFLTEMIVRHRSEDADIVIAFQDSIWMATYDEVDDPEGEIVEDIAKRADIDLDMLASAVMGFQSYIEDERPDIFMAAYRADTHTIYINEHRLSHHPSSSKLIRKVVQALDYPDVEMSRTKEDDESGEEIEYTYPMDQMHGRIPDVLYHGTTDRYLQSIAKLGIAPGRSPSNWSSIGIEHDKVVFGVSWWQKALFHANRTAESLGGNPIIIAFRVPDPDKVVPDYDIAVDMVGVNKTTDRVGYTNIRQFANRPDTKARKAMRGKDKHQNVWKDTGIFGYAGRIPPTHLVKIIGMPAHDRYYREELGENQFMEIDNAETYDSVRSYYEAMEEYYREIQDEDDDLYEAAGQAESLVRGVQFEVVMLPKALKKYKSVRPELTKKMNALFQRFAQHGFEVLNHESFKSQGRVTVDQNTYHVMVFKRYQLRVYGVIVGNQFIATEIDVKKQDDANPERIKAAAHNAADFLGESVIFEYDERYEYWIDDAGNMIDVSDRGHERAAADILDIELDEHSYEASDQAFMNGWIRVMASGNEFGTEWKQPTRRAVKALAKMVRDVPEFTNYYFGKMSRPIVGKRPALAWLGQELRQSEPVRESQEELLRLNQESQRLHKNFHQAWNDYKDNPSEETGKAFKAAKQAYYAVANQEQELRDQQRMAEPEPEQHEYRGQHEAPGPDDAPLHDLTQNGIYPDDIYGPNGLRYYATTDEEHAALSQALQFQGRPNAQVRIYRAVPTSAGKVKIEPGDWVTISRRYAKEHGQDNLGGNFRIISKIVNARSLFTDGNSPEEWGYHPQPPSPSLLTTKPNRISSLP